MNKIKVVVKEPLKIPEVKEIENSLESKQSIVGGYIQYIPFEEFDLYLNEEGKLEGLPSNLLFPNDVAVGTVYVTKANDEGSDIGLTDEECKKAIELLNQYAIKNEQEAAHYDKLIQTMF